MAESRSKPRSIRFRPGTLEAIEDEAKRNGMSVNAWVEKVAHDAILQSSQKADEAALRQSATARTEAGENNVSEPASTKPVGTTTGVEEAAGPSEPVGTSSDGLTAEQMAQVLAASTEPETDDTAMALALKEAYEKAGMQAPVQAPPDDAPPAPVREVSANPLPESVTSQWMPDADDVYEPGEPDARTRPGAPQDPDQPRAVFANDPLGMLEDRDEMPPEVNDEPDPYHVRPAGERWRPKEGCRHLVKVTQQEARRVVCGDCNEVLNKW